MKFLALGDSYTCGEGVSYQQSWPLQLMDFWRIKQLNLHVIAQTGWRSDELLKMMRVQLVEQDYDMFSLLVGVNDHFQGIAPHRFSSTFRKIIDLANRYTKPNALKVVLTIPDWTETPAAKHKKLIQYRQEKYPQTKKQNRLAAKEQLQQYNLSIKQHLEHQASFTLINLEPIYKQYKNEVITEDFLHPNSRQYQKWAMSIDQHIECDKPALKENIS